MLTFQTKAILLGGVAAAVLLLILVKKKGAAADAGEAIGGAAVELAEGAVVGGLDGISTVIGIPTTKETITDVAQCRAYMDANGTLTGLYACSTSAFNGAVQPVEAVKETVGDWWDWLTTPSPSDYKPKPTTGAFDRQ